MPTLLQTNRLQLAGKRLLWLLTLLLSLATSASAQLPAARLNSVFPAGGQPGQFFEVAVAGSDLEDLAQLRFSHPGITATLDTSPPEPVEPKSKQASGRFTVAIAGDVPGGLYEARVVGRYGISSPRAFMVGQWPESVEIEPNQPESGDFSQILERANEVTLASNVNGVCSGGIDVDYFKFTARRGERVLIDCWAHRIDSRLDGTLAVFDARGRRLAMSRDVNRRDPLIDLEVPADGTYVVKVWDFVYGGGGRDGAARSMPGDYFYRLAIGTAPYIDYVFPPAGLPGTSGQFTIYGRNLPGGSTAEGVELDGRPLEKLVVNIAIPSGNAAQQLQFNSLIESDGAGLDGFEYRLTSPQGESNPVVIGIAQAPTVEEREPNDRPKAAQRVALPCEYVGQFQSGADQDWVEFEAAKGYVTTLEVIATRQRSPCDPLVTIQRVMLGRDGQESVEELEKLDDSSVNLGGYTFDTRSDDPSHRFVPPEDGLYRVMLTDLSQGSDPRAVYRLSMRPESPDFRLVAVPISRNRQEKKVLTGVPLLRRGGTAAVQVLALRRDSFAEEIRLSVQGLPPGVTCSDAVIGPGAPSAALVFRAADDAVAASRAIRVFGTARIGDREVVREARGGSVIWNAEVQNNEAADARLTRDIALAITDLEAAYYMVESGDEKIYESSRPGKLEIPLKVTRRGGFQGAIALSAVGLPKDVKINNVNFAADQREAVLQLDVTSGAPLGTHSFYFTATGEVTYGRSSERNSKPEKVVTVEPVLPLTIRIHPDVR